MWIPSMVCCLNPDCANPQNPDGEMYCQSCNTLLIPLLRGRYRILKVLSDEGGFGRTYLSEDIDKLNELCVVKQFAPKVQGTAAMKKAVELFRQEAQRLQHLGEHDQIPALFAYFEEDNYLFLVQQLINGQNLVEELRQGAVYNEDKIVDLLLNLLPVLKFIHERGVIHRDIKPHNIIRRYSDGQLVLIDFGAAKQVTATMQTQLGTTIGSLGYTPIEQMQYGKAYFSSDLFSLGATCFHLLTGISPSKLWMTQGYGWIDTWQQYWNASDLEGDLSATLVKVLNKLLETDLQKRYQSADEVIDELMNQRSLILKSPTRISGYPILPKAWPVSFLLRLPPIQKLFSQRFQHKFKQRLLVNAVIMLLGLGGVWYLYSLPQSVSQSSDSAAEPYTLKGHSSDVNSVAFSPNGEFLASGSDDKTIKVWNFQTGEKIHTLQGHSGWIWAIAFAPDGKTLVSAGADKTIKLWNLATGEQIRNFQGHSQGVASVAFSPDGQTLVSGGLDKTIKLWNLGTGKEISTLQGHSQAVANVAFSPDGKTLASGSWDRTIKLWNLATSQVIRTWEGHSDIVISVAFSPDGMTLASGSRDKTIKLWNLLTGEVIRTLRGHTDKINSLAYMPRTNNKTISDVILASASNDNTIKLWNLTTGKNIRTLKRDSGYIYSVVISPDGKHLASGGSAENIIKIWPMSW